ncbi:glycosyltransferase family 2 protein [bacterium]|nr:glycosyltransferase family 2 protein [bacterium]
MRFSICVPVYNVENFIEECVHSILIQTFNDFEVIFINDGSTDESLQRLKKICQKDKRIKIINKKNEGLLWARRDAIKIASGEYVLFIDSDDKYPHEHVLKYLNDYIQKYNRPDLILFNRLEFSSDGIKNSNPFYNYVKLFEKEDLKEIRYQFITRNYFNAMFLKCIKREILQSDDTNYKIHNPQMAEDIAQSIYMFDKSKSILYIPDVFYLYRINPNSITNAPLAIDKLERKMVRKLFSILLESIEKWGLQSYKNDVFKKYYEKTYLFYITRIMELLNSKVDKELISNIVKYNWFNEDNLFLNNQQTLKQAKLRRGDHYLILSIIKKDEKYFLKGYRAKRKDKRILSIKKYFKRIITRG